MMLAGFMLLWAASRRIEDAEETRGARARAAGERSEQRSRGTIACVCVLGYDHGGTDSVIRLWNDSAMPQRGE